MVRVPALARSRSAAALLLLATLCGPLIAAEPAAPADDAALARSTGADDRGMRKYVLVVLRTGPTLQPTGEARDRMYAGHFANIQRLAADKKLVVASPFDGKEGRRCLYIFAVKDVKEARRLVTTNPVVQMGEMVPEFRVLYGSAALMLVNDLHARLEKRQP